MRKKVILFAILTVAAGVSLTCSPGYVIRAGIEEAKILSRRRPIQEVSSDPATAAETRRKLELVLQARTFAAEYLGLDAGESYTTFSRVDRDTLLMVVSAARKDRFQQHTWWFPIVGRVPYKGYFDFESAYEEAASLEAKGFDAYVRPTAAFSTLGWFNDPLLSTVLRSDDVFLVATVIHEITHNTLYIPSRVSFNESFASFVGDRGAVEFFCGVEGPDGPRCTRAAQAWRDNLRFGVFLSSMIEDLETLYDREDLSREETLARRESAFAAARERFHREVAPELELLDFGRFMDQPLNNATLIARRIYFDRLHLFEAAYRAHGGDLRRTVATLMRAADDADDDPFAAVTSLVGDVTPPLPVHPVP